MLEHYFSKPSTLDRISVAWLGEDIRRYVTSLHEQKYAIRSIQRRVPVLMHLSEFTQGKGVKMLEELPPYVEPFVNYFADRHQYDHPARNRQERRAFARSTVRHFLEAILPNYSERMSHRQPIPFAATVPGYFDYLTQERGLRPASVKLITHNIRRLELYFRRIELESLNAISPAILSAFMADSSQSLCKKSLRALAAHLRVFLRYLYREGTVDRDLGNAVEAPTNYRLAEVPRSISWTEVGQLLAAVDRRTPVGKRDYAILLLLVTYGLRAREIAAMTLDDFDWERARFRVPERKASHFTAYPLSTIVAAAIVEYLQHARTQTDDRHLFLLASVPYHPINHHVVSLLVSRHLKRSGISVTRAGSHTLRHTCVQRLIDANFDLKTVGDYVGHGSPASTEIYTKINVEALREIALGDGEAIL